MSFPTADEVASFALFTQLDTIRDLVLDARPDLSQHTEVGAREGKLMLTVDLPPTRAGYARRVILGRVHGNHLPYWLIVGSQTRDTFEFAWELSTPRESLRDSLLATYDACLSGGRLESPWRWSEPRHATVVRIADGLDAKGVEVTGVVATNRLMPDAIEGARAPHSVPLEFGDALRVEMTWGTAVLARKPTLGWVLDANDHLRTRRLDLGSFATGSTSRSPGLSSDDSDLLISAVVGALQAGPWDFPDGELKHAQLPYSDYPQDGVTAWWLRELGYPDARPRGCDLPGVDGPFHVVTHSKRCGLGTVKTAFADAALAHKPLVMFAEGGFTRDASRWADQARIALYTLYNEVHRISASSALAEEHVPKVI